MPAIVDHTIQYHPDGIADVTVRSAFSGNYHTRRMALTSAQYTTWVGTGVHIQTALPHLSPEDREFLLTGATPEEWELAFGSDEED